MIINCNDLWTRFVHVVYGIRRREVLTPTPPPPAAPCHPDELAEPHQLTSAVER